MLYYTRFYGECPRPSGEQAATELEIEIEVIFSCDEEESQESFWGFPVSLPASGEIEILEVFRDQEEWFDYPDYITKQLHDEEWTACEYSIPHTGKRSISKSINLKPCKRRLAA